MKEHFDENNRMLLEQIEENIYAEIAEVRSMIQEVRDPHYEQGVATLNTTLESNW
jgi:hypothetical protein